MAQRCRTLAFVTEQLEVRSVPSGFGAVSLSALTSADQSAFDSAAPLAREVATESNLGGPAVVIAPVATAPSALVRATVPTATVAVLDALDSVFKMVDAAPVPVISPIDVSATIPASTVPPSIATGAGNIVTDLVGALDDALDALTGGAVADSGGAGVGNPIATVAGSVGAEISASVSGQGIALTHPGLSVDVKLPGSPFDPTGGSPVPNPPSNPTLPPSPSDPTAPTMPSAPAIPSAPTSGGGSTAAHLPSSGSPWAGASPGASPASPTGSTADDPEHADGSAAGTQSAALVPNGLSAASPGVLGETTAHEAASSTTGPFISPVVSVPTVNGAAMSRDRLDDQLSLADSLYVDAEPTTGPQMTPAELLPGDLESLESALAQLMRRFDGMGEDLAGWFARSGMLDMLVGAGMVVLASEVFRRWGRRLAIPRAQAGSAGRPGPFYRLRAYPFGSPGSGRPADRPALI